MKLYVYAKCSTCRKAMAWLEKKGIEFEEIAIKETQPTVKELKEVQAIYGGERRRLFNTSGMDYREMELKDKLPTMSEKEAYALLRSNGMLVKRPFLVGAGVGLVGFREMEWEEKLG
ncbi:MAG: arsenate reductase family protein [Akkermansiaceae bacterium]|nr:arsenate reductase family protein [Akkermansiaceae bacterium]